jgi:asparagine synthase (glutamine-hydrolysing)
MCGIAGIFSFKNILTETELIKMRDSMVHRGPDGGGLWSSENKKVMLGHRRLSIIDLSETANQPMGNEDDSIKIIFNGEIFNYAEIRPELEKCGHKFKTDHSDTEVILHAYEEWGYNCVHKFRGMFAFALWDDNKKLLWIVRDRIGIKPLFWAKVENKFLFASEIKALFSDPELKKEIDPQSISDYLSLLTVPAPRTMFKNIFKLEAGKMMIINEKGDINIEKYWDMADYLNNPLTDITDNEAFLETEKLISESVNLRLISDVPLGVTFSGGIDSSIIAAYMKKHVSDINAITIDYNIKSEYSELEIARQISKQIGFNLVEKSIDEKDFAEGIDKYINIQNDFPAGDPNTILMYLISKKVKELGLTVILVGEGGDELGGYPYYLKINDEYKYLRLFNCLPDIIKQSLYKMSPTKIKRLLGFALGDSVISRTHINGFADEIKYNLLVNNKFESSYNIIEKYMDEISAEGEDLFLRKVLNVEYKNRLPELILPRVDYPTMANSLEARVPFLDHKLVEFSARLPFKIKMKNREAKSILKNILSKYIDKDLIYRKKIGFGMLLTNFLNYTIPIWVDEEILKKADHPLFDYIKRESLASLVDDHNKNLNQGYKLWVCYVLGKWIVKNN